MRKRIVVLGYIVRGPLGGLSWHHLQYVLGLKEIGHEVLFVEDSDDYPSCYNPETNTVSEDPAYGLRFIDDLFRKFDIGQHWSYFDAHKNEWFGRSEKFIMNFCRKADIVLNLSGVNPWREWWGKIPSRVFIDTDPAFTQIRNLTDAGYKNLTSVHNCFFTFGENIGKNICSIPDDGFNWLPTRQPVYLNAWQISTPQQNSKWTTVMQWDSYKTGIYNGKEYGMKSASFDKFIKLPGYLPDTKFKLAIGSESAPVDRLEKSGWEVISSLIPSKSPRSYQEFIQCSKGEWSVAKEGYVSSNSGWFSERSLCYMASGKPVVVQDTGFSNNLETGKGLFAFSTLDEAIEAIKIVNDNYNFHCLHARQIVENNFNSENVLRLLINTISGIYSGSLSFKRGIFNL